MIYNLHPIFVHFPIAFLILYSLIVLLPLQKWFPKITFKITQNILLFTGTVGIFLAKATGETAQEIVKPDNNIVEMHELFANITTWFYVLLVVITFLPFIISFLQKKCIRFKKIISLLQRVHSFLNKNLIIKTSAFLGVISLFITGLLGGVMVYGLSVDPIAPFILKILGL